LFIAGGIGITPLLSMIRSFDDEALVPWKLIYLSRHADETAFLEELGRAELKKNVRIHHTEGDPEQQFDLWPALEKPNTAQVYCCGPRALMEAVRDMTGHWSPKNIHFESFDEGGKTLPDDKPFHVTLARGGQRFEVPVGTSILNAMRAHGCNAAASCESGTCGTCRTKLLEGEADHRDMVLMPEEMDSNIMICVSRAKTAELVLDL
jgi:phthalate 4,5-dioxygenase reductase subunit